MDSSKFWIAIAVGVSVLIAAAVFVVAQLGKNKLEEVLESSQRARIKQDFSTLKSALSIYRLNSRTFPSTEQGLAALVSKPTTGSIPREWEPTMKTEMLDPWEQPYGYRFPPQNNQNFPDIYSIGPDGQAGTEDDVGNWQDLGP